MSYNFREIPHLLVAGQTGGGKSSFLRQFIATLYLKNTNFTFDLIDLKFSEFHVFKKLPRITVIEDISTSIDKICEVSEVMMERRKKLLSINECVDLDQFLKIPKSERKYPKGLSKKSNLSKHIVIIDEAIDLFLTGTTSTAQAKRAKFSAARIAAQGRVVGIHLVVATQRPDRQAVDPKIKANLVGRLCFRMANIASSMTVLDSKRATEIPEDIKGRAIWAGAKGQLEVQTPYLSIEGADELLSHLRESPLELKKEKNIEEEIKVPVAELNS